MHDYERTTSAGRQRVRMFLAGVMVVVVLFGMTDSLHAAPPPLSKAEKERIDAAIKKGVDYLRRTQGKNGTWDQHYKQARFVRDEGSKVQFGYEFIAGLALLECGVPTSDPGIQKIVEIVRINQRNLDETCCLSLAILFLDRLGESKNEALLQSLSVRLLAAQCRDGAWGYRCPSISPRNEKAILVTLRKLWPLTPAKRKVAPGVLARGAPDASPRQKKDDSSIPSRSSSSSESHTTDRSKRPSPVPARLIPAPLKILTVFQSVLGSNVSRPRRPNYLDVADTENVATHFALMALWTARRHEIPVDQSLRLLADYFQRSQRADGNWPYRYRNGINPVLISGDSRNMICIGLLGLASVQALKTSTEKRHLEISDPRILKSFKRLDRELGRPTGDGMRPPADPGTYFLWMVQQTAMAYGVETINGKDWYRWGAESLVNIQAPEGNWPIRIKINIPGPGAWYGASTSTSLALLFLMKYDPYRPISKMIQLDLKHLPK